MMIIIIIIIVDKIFSNLKKNNDDGMSRYRKYVKISEKIAKNQGFYSFEFVSYFISFDMLLFFAKFNRLAKNHICYFLPFVSGLESIC